MNETQLRELIAELIAELLPQAVAPAKPNALVLFTGALLGFEESVASLGRTTSVNLDWTQTDSASRILDQATIEAVGMTRADSSLVVSHDLLIVPTLTVNMAAKVVHGIGDCLASNVIAEFIMTNKPVIAVTNAACPDSADKRGWFPAMPEGYAAMLRDNLTRLRSFGVHLTSAAKLDRTVARVVGAAAPESAKGESFAGGVDCDLKVISESVIKSIPGRSRLRISRQAIVTDLAKEAAASANITIERV